MTMALCLNCGEIKFGALCECDKCKRGPTGNSDLDIAFSDHNCEVDALEEFGDVVKEIHRHSTDPSTCLWSFLQYVSDKHPSMLKVELMPEMKEKALALLQQCTMPKTAP